MGVFLIIFYFYIQGFVDDFFIYIVLGTEDKMMNKPLSSHLGGLSFLFIIFSLFRLNCYKELVWGYLEQCNPWDPY